MAQDLGAEGQPLEARRADILRRHHLGHWGAGHAGDISGAIDRHGHDGQREIVEVDFGGRKSYRVEGPGMAEGMPSFFAQRDLNRDGQVSMNEYIELSKMFSSQKSKIFINGVLDKLLAQFNRENQLKKTGRGLMQ